uniref:Uncharacterized protein n=1 Tax=Vitis vinifera TaxID=29760 RepID=F6I5C1_VITVI
MGALHTHSEHLECKSGISMDEGISMFQRAHWPKV